MNVNQLPIRANNDLKSHRNLYTFTVKCSFSDDEKDSRQAVNEDVNLQTFSRGHKKFMTATRRGGKAYFNRK